MRLFLPSLCAVALFSLSACGGSDQPAQRANMQAASTSQVSAPVINSLTFAGNRSRYTITVDNDAITVIDSLGVEAARTFSGPNLRFAFADVTVGFDVDGAAGQVYRLYKAAFNRQPDPAGLGFHLNAMESLGYSKNQIAQNFINSPEFSATYGPLDDTGFVTQLYQNVLGRAPDASGLKFYVDGLKGNIFSKSAVLEGFSESPENKAAVAASIRTGISYQAQPTVPGPVTVRSGVTFPLMAKIDYRTATQSGTTGTDGVFHYLPGELVTFSVGTMELASVPAAPVVTPLDVDNPVAGENLLRLAKALDADYNLTNGIVFPPAAKGPTLPLDFTNEAELKKALANVDPIAELPAPGDAEVSAALSAATRQAGQDATYSGTYDSFWLNRISSCTPRPTDPKSASFTFTAAPDWDKSMAPGTMVVTLENGGKLTFATTATAGTSPQGYQYTIQRGALVTKGRVIRASVKAAIAGGCDASMFLRDKAKPNLPPIPSSGVASIQGSQIDGHSYTVVYTHANYGGPFVLPTTALDWDGRVVLQEWSTSDGKKGTGNSFAVTVPAFSEVTVTLTATDDEGAKSTKTWTMGNAKKLLAEVLDTLAQSYYVSKDGPYSTYYKVDLTRTRVFEYECDDRLRGCEETVYRVADLDTKTFLEGLYQTRSGDGISVFGAHAGLDFIYSDKGTGEVFRFSPVSTLPPGYQIVKGGTGSGSAGGGPGSGAGTGEATGVTGRVTTKNGSARNPSNDPGTPTKVEQCVPKGQPPVMTPAPPTCYKSSPGIERGSAFSWSDYPPEGSLIDEFYANDDLRFYKAKDVSAPYCTQKGTVNGLPVPWLCRIYFTIGL
jgi:hypothetical protein